MKAIRRSTATVQDLFDALDALQERVDLLELVLIRTNLLLLEQRGTLEAPSDEAVTDAEGVLERANEVFMNHARANVRIRQEWMT